MRRLACGVVAVLALTARSALAEEASEPVHVHFEDGAVCSDASRFFDELRGRTARVRQADAGEGVRTFDVRIVARGERRVGTLAISDGSSVSAPRTLEARSCDELVDALAFIAALSVDPSAHAHAVLRPPPPPAPPPPAPPAPPVWVAPPLAQPPWLARAADAERTSEVSESETPLDPSAPAPADAPTVVPERTSSTTETPIAGPAAAPPERTRPKAPARPPSFFVAVGAGPTANLPNAPQSGVGGRAFVELGRVATKPLAFAGRVTFDLPTQETVQPDPANSGRVNLSWTRGALDVCPARFGLLPNLTFAPCGGVEVGALTAQALNVADPRTSTQPWVAALAEGRLRFVFLRWLFAEVDAGLTVPLTREQFAFATTTAYQAPPVFFRGLFALGVRFP